MYWLKVHEIPQAGRRAREAHREPRAARQGEKVAAILPVRRLPEPAPAGREAERRGGARSGVGGGGEAALAGRGRAVRVHGDAPRPSSRRRGSSSFSRPRAAGIIALGIEDGDELIAARLTDGSKGHVLLSTAQGMSIRFEESDVRPMGRTAYGVKGITLEEGDAVVSAETIPAAPRRRARADDPHRHEERLRQAHRARAEYRVQSRGGKGIINIKTTERNGPVVAAAPVTDAEEVMLITNGGMLIRMPAKGISVIGRNTQGVRLITLESKEEEVVGVARVAETTPEAEAAGVREARRARRRWRAAGGRGRRRGGSRRPEA